MLAEARGKGLYDRLIEADIVQFLATEAAAQARYHLIFAADVFMYLPDLVPVLKAAVAPCWRPAALSPSASKPMTARA